MALQLSRILGLGLRRGVSTPFRMQNGRWLCSSTGSKGGGSETVEEASSTTSDHQEKKSDLSSTDSQPSPDVLEVMRNFKPPNADEYAVEANEKNTDVAAGGVQFSQSIAYRMSVEEALGVTASQQVKTRRAMRARYVIHATIMTTMFYLLYILPGEEEIDEVTGEVFREPPGWVDAYNSYLEFRAYIRGEKKPKRYVWTS